MKKFNSYLILSVVLVFTACNVKVQNAEDSSMDQNTETATAANRSVITPRFPSPAATLEQTVGLSTIKISYSRPNVISPQGINRTGKIWGGLVPHDFNFRPVASKGKPAHL